MAVAASALPEARQASPQPDTTQVAAEHVRFLGIALNDSLSAMLDEMERRQMQLYCIDTATTTFQLSGQIADMEMMIDIMTDRTFRHINCIRLSSPKADRNQKADYNDLFDWLCDEYDEPDWRGTVRSHHFCRWFVDFDRDIILIATGSGNVEVWLYENHLKRNIDYYSILKYCEKNPAESVPAMTAEESITWKRNPATVVRKHVAKRKTKSKRVVRKSKPARRKAAAKKRRRR